MIPDNDNHSRRLPSLQTSDRHLLSHERSANDAIGSREQMRIWRVGLSAPGPSVQSPRVCHRTR